MSRATLSRPRATAHQAAAPAAVPAEIAQPHFGYDVTKRALDIVVSAVGLVLAAPLFLLVAFAIKLESRGPVIYTHYRVGQHGAPFRCYKFRSMRDGAVNEREQLRHLDITGGPAFKTPADPRITRFGKLIRKTSIDELPQLFCVLRGDMSLVGPRPLPVEDYSNERQAELSERTNELMQSRLQVKPGLTGIWQVSGRSLIAFDRWMELDAEYLERRSLALDLWLLVRTVPAVLTSRGAL